MPLSPETLVYGFRSTGDPQIAPDGETIVYVLSAPGPAGSSTAHLWRCRRDGSDAEQITFAGKRNTLPRWSPDGSMVASVSDRSATNGLFIQTLTGQPRELVAHRQQIVDLCWSPDSRTIAYAVSIDPANPAETPRPAGTPPPVRVVNRVDYKQENRGFLGDTRWQIVTIDIATGTRRQLSSLPFDHTDPAFSPDSRWLGATLQRDNTMHGQLVLYPIEGGGPRLIGPATGKVDSWSWSPDGRTIAIVAEVDRSWQPDLYLYDVESERIDCAADDLLCLPDSGFPTILAPSRPIWIDDSTLLIHGVHAGSSGLYTLDVPTGGLRLLHRYDALNTGLSVDGARRFFVQGSSSLDYTGEIVVYDREAHDAQVITTHSGAVLAENPPALSRKFGVRRGGMNIDGWILMPPDFDPAKKYPVVLDIHGGPNAFYGYGWNAIQQLLATHGFVVVYCNPRGSAGYGREFTSLVFGDWGNEDWADVQAILDTALERPGLDRDRVGIWGYSYGGYLTSWAIGHTDRFKAAVVGAPAYDLASMFGTSDISHVFGRYQWGGPPAERREWYAERSPSTHIHNATTPTLIIHGEADDRCPIGQGEMLYVDLLTAGVPTEFIRYPGAAHALLRTGPPEYREDVLRRMLAWFQRYLGVS